MESPTGGFRYPGSELEIFAAARNWKAYWRARIAPHVGGRVLEVGAGIGANTLALAGLGFDDWNSLEPDALLAAKIPALGLRHRVTVGVVADVDGSFDTVLYLDVLEHVADDRAELARATSRLAPGGTLVVLSPAHPWLFTPFDRAIGHHRRYTRAMFRAIAPPSLREIEMRYLDSAGLLASLANRLLLQAEMPTERQIRTWDRCLVPCSRGLDRITGGFVGKSILAVWKRPG